MRKRLILAALFAAVSTRAGADVAPLTPEGRVIMDKRQAFEAKARERLGDIGLVERLRDWRKFQGFVIVGSETSPRAPRVLAKDEYGWYEIQPGRTQRLSPSVGLELTRLLSSAAAWIGDSYNYGLPCRETPRLFVVAYAGRDQFGRLGCGPEGLAGRAARIAETLQAPLLKRSAILPAWEKPPVEGIDDRQQQNNADIYERLSNMVSAWDGKRLPGYVDAYADDVIVERPEGTIKGRKALVDWVRHEQDWAEAYPQRWTRHVLTQMTMPAQASNQALYTTHEIRWEGEDGRLKRQTFSTMWRNNAGLWQIAYERVSPVKPVTDGRPL